MSEKLSRRKFLRVAAVGAGALLAASCQPKVVEVEKVVTKEVEKIVKETVIIAAEPAPKEPVTIQWMNWWGAAREPLMLEIIARFEEEYPYITVENQVQPWDNREQRAATAIASKTPPSLIMVPRVEAQMFAHEGLIVPIDDYIQAKGIDVYDVFYEGDINNCRWADHFWSYPLPSGGVDSSFWLYGKNMLREAGLDPESPPKTWQEVEKAIDATTVIKDGVLEAVGLGGVTGRFHSWLYCNDGKYYSDDSKQLLFNQPEGVETLEWMLKLISEKMGGIEAYNAFGEGVTTMDADYAFYTDKLCFGPYNVSIFGHFRNIAPERFEDTDAWGTMLVPYNGNNPKAKATGLSGFAFSWNQVIPKGLSKEVQDAAYEWLEYFGMRRAGGCWFMFEQARPSPVKACNENPEYYDANPYWDVVLQALAIDISVPVTPVQGQIADLVSEALEEVWFEVKTPKDALDWAYDKTQPILDKFWAEG